MLSHFEAREVRFSLGRRTLPGPTRPLTRSRMRFQFAPRLGIADLGSFELPPAVECLQFSQSAKN